MIEGIQERVRKGGYRFTIHAFERCVERDISPEHIRDAILAGEIIEDYPEDKYGPVVSFMELRRPEKSCMYNAH